MSVPATPCVWRPLFWEPVAGTGERLMIGLVYQFGDQFGAVRTLREEVLTCLYGKQAKGAQTLIEFSLSLYEAAANAARSVEGLEGSMGGLHSGPQRETEAQNRAEMFRQAVLMYSSLASLEKLDLLEEPDSPLQDEVNRRFATDVRSFAEAARPDLSQYFGRSVPLVMGGQRVKFGFCSPVVIAHFSVLYPGRASASMRDARARLFELQQGKLIAGLGKAVLISAVPRDEEPTIGDKQRAYLADLKSELNQEAASTGIAYVPVHTAQEGADRLLAAAA